MALLIANSTRYGRRAGLLTVLGNGFGLCILVAAATLGLTSIMALVAEWFDVIRWIGAAYLVWLGLTRLRAAWQHVPGEMPSDVPSGGTRWFWHGLAVALSNPKVLLFLGAFFPQFVDPGAAIAPQLAILAVTFVVVIMLTDALMALAADAARGWFLGRGARLLDGASGTLLICGAAWLAMTRRAA